MLHILSAYSFSSNPTFNFPFKGMKAGHSLNSYGYHIPNFEDGRVLTRAHFKYSSSPIHNIVKMPFYSLHEKCQNMEYFLVRILLYSVRIQENTDPKNSVFGHFPCSDYFCMKIFLDLTDA